VVALDRERRVVYCNRPHREMLSVRERRPAGDGGRALFPRRRRWLKGVSRETRDFRLKPKAASSPQGEALPSVMTTAT